ncbi:MAG TPA: hypothetical protein VK386_05935 [Acidimicrobiales bacterium]|nr:hypothetical protein [Acidimicrobiales bacterium]
MIAIESCHSTWFFDPVRMRFRRVVKGLGEPWAATQWRPYYGLALEETSATFVITLDAAGRRFVRSWRHPPDCAECGEHPTAELALDALATGAG